jgi:type I restriction enzyme M protein
VQLAARIDGYNILLRSLEVHRQEAALEDSKCWTAPVRRFVEAPEWESADGTLQGSHDDDGTLRPEFLKDRRIYDGDRVKEEYLDPDCIESNDYNLSAGRYKPFKLKTKDYDQPADIIRDLQKMENGILKGLDDLLEMVEGVE